jgi:ribonuclease-3
MLLGEAEKKSSRNQSERLQADAFEALIGAVYMDSGLADAAKIIVSLLEPYIEEALKSKTGYPDDYKSKLQELMHTLTGETPVYRMIDSTGPDHDKYFKVEVNLNINNNHFSEQGMGKSIQKAEQQAAHKILSVIEKNRDGIFSDEKI